MDINITLMYIVSETESFMNISLKASVPPPPPPGREIITCMRWSVGGVGGA